MNNFFEVRREKAVATGSALGAETNSNNTGELKILKSRINLNLFNMKNIFVKIFGIAAIMVLSLGSYAQCPPGSTNYTIRLGVCCKAPSGGLPTNVCARYDINCCTNPNGDPEISGRIEFYDCNDPGNRVTFQILATFDITAGTAYTNPYDWTFYIVYPWGGTDSLIGHDITVVDTSTGNGTSFTLGMNLILDLFNDPNFNPLCLSQI